MAVSPDGKMAANASSRLRPDTHGLRTGLRILEDHSIRSASARIGSSGPSRYQTPFLASGLYHASFGPSGFGVWGQTLRPARSGESHFDIFTV